MKTIQDLYRTSDGQDKVTLWKWLLDSEHDPDLDLTLMDMLESTGPEEDIDLTKAYSSISSSLNLGRKFNFHCALHWIEKISIAAMIPLIAVVCTRNRELEDVVWNEVRTGCGETFTLNLPDGSTIDLGPNTKVLYPSAFMGDERKIFLSGTSKADIAHLRKDKPFIISLSDLDVVVTGTEFTIDAYDENEEAVVALIDGTLQVRKKGEQQGMYLTSGYIATYNRVEDRFAKSRFDSVSYKDNSADGNITYFNKPLSDIALDLEKRFGVRIYLEDEEVRNLTYYASFINNEDAAGILSVLNANGSLKIKAKDNIFQISMNK